MAGLTLDFALRDQISGLPTKQEVSDRIEAYRGIARSVGGFPPGVRFEEGKGLVIGGSGDRAYQPNGTLVGGQPFFRNGQTVAMLKKYAEISGEILPTEIVDGLKGLDKQFASYMSDPVVAKWVNRGSELMSTSLAASSQVQSFGIEALKLGQMTIELATSGEYITDKQTMAFSLSAGASAGGLIGSIIPGIGTAIGTAVGAAVGAVVGAITSAFTRPNFDKTLKEQAGKAADEAARLRGYCATDLEKQINASVYETLYKISEQWVNAEMTLGYRFDLRWFDSNPGIRFEGPAQKGEEYLDKLLGHQSGSGLTPKQPKDGFDYPYGRFRCFIEERQRQGMVDYQTLKGQRVYGQETLGICNFYCPEPILGCLYPAPAMNPFHAYGSPRVQAAFYSRGVELPINLHCDDIAPVMHDPPKAGDVVDCTKIDGWGNKGKKGEAANLKCAELVGAATHAQAKQLEREAKQKVDEFSTAAKFISSDLTKTIALMQSKQAILLNSISLTGEGVFSDVATNFVAAQDAHVRRMNRIAVVGGAALVGLAAWKGLR